MNKILIIYPSWEERSYLDFENLVVTSNINKLFLIEKKDSLNQTETDASLMKIKDVCTRKNIDVDIIDLAKEPYSTFENLEKLVKNISQEDEVTIDITTMSRNIIWSLLFFVKQKILKINIVYYCPSDYMNNWISREPSKPRLLFKHSGIIDLDLKNCLVIITGFDVDRTKQLVRYYDPQKIILLVQTGNKFDNSIRNKGELHKQMCEELGYTNIEILDIDAYSSDFGLSVIEKVIRTNMEDYNMIFASLGPKLSAISLYKAYISHPEIALSYVPCKEYNIDYCSGIGLVFNYNLELDNE